MIRIISIMLVFFSIRSFAQGAKLQSIHFKTTALTTRKTSPSGEKWQKKVKAEKQFFPEGMAVIGALMVGRDRFRLSEKQQQVLTKKFTEVYIEIAKDPLFKNIPSVLPEALTRMQQEGHYFLYRPDNINSRTPAIVFLHGFGGNFLFYPWVLKKRFPNHIILLPSNGISWAKGKAELVSDMLDDAEKRLKIKLSRPWLMAISAGGPAGFRIYNADSEKFKGYICIASAPGKKTVTKLKPNLNILMLNGTKDKRFPLDRIKKRIQGLKTKIRRFKLQEINSDHFFLLTEQDKAFASFKNFMNSKN